MSKPVAQLSAEVAKAQNAAALPQLSTTGIAEVDQFASAISQLSSDMLASSTRFLRIMEMASVELAGYELRSDSVYVTDNFFRMLGVQTPDPLTPSSFRAALSAVAHSSLYRTTPIGSSIFTIAQPDGSVQYIVLRITRIVAQTPSEVGLLEDVTSAILEQQRIEHERDYDILTGLYSRQAFNRVCADLFAHPDRLRCAALLMMDLDNLKHINDTYGHDWGDQYIRQTGQCFAANTPKGTVCSRLSGDEFLLLFYGYDSQDAIRNYERVVLFISSGMLHQLGQGLLPLEQRLLDCTRRTGYHYQLDEAALSLCTTCIDRVAQNTGDERPESRLADYAAMTEFLLQILRVTQEAPMLQSTQPSPDTMQRVMAYINEHYAQPLTLEEIADAFFISKSYLSHEFVRYTNTSVYEYIQFRRICGAKLLIASGVSLTDAAFQSGFNSYSSFLRTFRKTAGISPTDFQRNLGK